MASPPPLERSATSDSPRARRFALPDLEDSRADEAIDAFLAGPARRRGRADAEPVSIGTRQPFGGLASRVAWTDALARESARQRRYGRTASVVVFEVEALGAARQQDGWLERLAGPIAHAIHRGARETDLVTRASPARFQVLLPETSQSEASRFADRVTADCAAWLNAFAAPVAVRAAAASATGDAPLEDALERALALLAAD